MELIDNPELAARMVREGKLSVEEAESYMSGIHLCEFRALLCGKDPIGWDCLNCKENGFETCEIECNIPCEQCIRFNLCRVEGRIAKCEKCGEWYIKEIGCDCDL